MFDLSKDVVMKGKLDQEPSELTDIFLVKKESVVSTIKLSKARAVFTDKRVVLIASMRVMSKRVDTTHIPYKSLEAFSVEGVDALDKGSSLTLLLKTGAKMRFDISGEAKIAEIAGHISNAIV